MNDASRASQASRALSVLASGMHREPVEYRICVRFTATLHAQSWDPEICINMKSIEVVNLVKRAPPESLPQSLKFISSETSPIFEECDSDIEKPSQVIPKRNISDEVATVQSPFKSKHPSCQLRSSVVSGNTDVKAMPSGIVRGDGGNRGKDENYAYFKTRSGKLERHLSRLLSIPRERDDEVLDSEEPEIEYLPARRFFDALQGPELEIIRIFYCLVGLYISFDWCCCCHNQIFK